MALPKTTKRQYNSLRRKESAEQTRQAIIDAAIKLHAQGITAFGAVAQEAGVSLPTVQKHFPTRDDLFRACTGHSITIMPPPHIDTLAGISDPAERLLLIVHQLYRFHETKLGASWNAYTLQRESPVLAQVLASGNALIGAAADAILQEWKTGVSPPQTAVMKGFVRGLLSPLTYRALRLEGGLDVEDATRQTAQALANALGIDLRPILDKTLSLVRPQPTLKAIDSKAGPEFE